MGEDDRALTGPREWVGDFDSMRRDDGTGRWKEGVSRKCTEETEAEWERVGLVDMACGGRPLPALCAAGDM